jgi:hypothetical protein
MLKQFIIILSIISVNKLYAQSLVDKLVYEGTLEIGKEYVFNLEQVILMELDQSSYSFEVVDTDALPEYIDADEIELFQFNEDINPSALVGKDIYSATVRMKADQYFSDYFGSINFITDEIVNFFDQTLIFNVEKSNSNYGNEKYTFNLSSSSGRISLPLVKIENSYKIVLSDDIVKSLGVRVTGNDEVPFKAEFNGNIIYENLSIRSIEYELNRDTNYFQDYQIIPYLKEIIRLNVTNTQDGLYRIDNENLYYIFNLDEVIK